MSTVTSPSSSSLRNASAEEFAAGRDLEEAGAVKVAEEDRGMIRYTIAGGPPQTVTLTRQLVLHCSCPVFLKQGCCRHAVAAWLTADRTKVIESMNEPSACTCDGIGDASVRQRSGDFKRTAFDAALFERRKDL